MLELSALLDLSELPEVSEMLMLDGPLEALDVDRRRRLLADAKRATPWCKHERLSGIARCVQEAERAREEENPSKLWFEAGHRPEGHVLVREAS